MTDDASHALLLHHDATKMHRLTQSTHSNKRRRVWQFPDELAPFAERFTPRFLVVATNVRGFIMDDVIPLSHRYKSELDTLVAANGGDAIRVGEPLVLNELRARAKARGVYNLFLPEVWCVRFDSPVVSFV